jgi:hypothetical protein
MPTFKFKNLHRNKDVWIIIEEFKKIYDYETYILTQKNENKYIWYKSKIIIIKNEFLWFILNIFSLKPNLLIMFHISRITFMYAIIYKIINFKWKIYIKSDCDLKNTNYKKNNNLSKFFILFLKIFDKLWYISFENKTDVDFLNNNYQFNFFHIPNWINEYIWNYNINNFRKENLIITVWRLWSYQKNTQEFLQIVKPLLEKDKTLKTVLIWEIQDETKFAEYLNKYLLENKNISDRIIFTWKINQNEVFEYYKKSKFFILTSRYEWFACTLPEAGYFWNIIIARDVWWVNDITNNWEYWLIYKNISEIETFINKCSLKPNEINKYIKNNYSYSKIISNINNKVILWK